MNKKIIVIVVIVECILAILLVSILGKAIENYNSEVMCREIYFVDENGIEYKEDAIIEVKLSDTVRDYQLYYKLLPENTSDKSVTFTTDSEDVVVTESGLLTFLEDTSVTVTVRSKNGKSASIRLVPERKMSGDVTIE